MKREAGKPGRYLKAKGLLHLHIVLCFQMSALIDGLPQMRRAGGEASMLARDAFLGVGCSQTPAQALCCLQSLLGLACVLVVQQACVGHLYTSQTTSCLQHN